MTVSTRQLIDRIVIALLICIMIALGAFFAVFVITTDIAQNGGSLFDMESKKESESEKAKIPAYEADADHPLAKYAIECERDYDEFIKKVKEDDRYSNPVSLTHDFSYMYNFEHKMAIGSLDYIAVAPLMGSNHYDLIIRSEEFKASFPARSASFNFDGRSYCVYYAGCEDTQIKDFLKYYSLVQDKEEIGKIFRIEEIGTPSEYETYTYTLSTGPKITMTKPLSVIFEMKDYDFEYSYSKKQ